MGLQPDGAKKFIAGQQNQEIADRLSDTGCWKAVCGEQALDMPDVDVDLVERA